MATVAIVTPIYATSENKRLSLFHQTVRSVINQQTFTKIVYVVVDDGSPLKVEKFLEDFKDSRIRYVHRDRSPLDINTASNALNIGLEHCLSRSKEVFSRREADTLCAVAFLHSDDLLATESVEKRLRYLKEGFVYTNMAVFGKEEKIVAVFNPKSYESKEAMSRKESFLRFPHHTIVWEMNFLNHLKDYIAKRYGQQGIFDSELWMGEDRDVSMSSLEAAVEHKDAEIRYIPFISVFYRQHKNSITGESLKKVKEMKEQNERIYYKHFKSKQGFLNLYLRSIPLQRLLSDMPWSLFTYLPEDIKKNLRPVRDIMKDHINTTNQSISDLEQQLLTIIN